MTNIPLFNRLSVKLTASFLLAAILVVALVALFAYRTTSSDFNTFMGHVRGMEGMMGGDGMMGSGMMGDVALALEAQDFLNNLGRTLWIAGLSGVALALLLGYLSTRHIVAPLGRVTVAARRIAGGDLAQRVEISGSGELAELGKSFNFMAETLSRDRELRKTMVADIAHELRTPLSVLQGNVEAMMDGVIQPNVENLNSLHDETLLLSRLVDDLRTLSLAEAGQLKLQPGETDLKAVSSRVIEGFQTQFASKRITATLDASEDLPTVWADGDRTAQVLRNIISNALHYTPDGGRVSIRLLPEDDGVTTSVTDSGIGIPGDELPRIFERFYRVDRSRTRSTGGTGLGLAIVKQLVESQGGRVWAKSKAGEGSTFSFWLPYRI